jgi:hypothetical protein
MLPHKTPRIPMSGWRLFLVEFESNRLMQVCGEDQGTRLPCAPSMVCSCTVLRTLSSYPIR